ncbi:hypothetical protein GJ496_005641 [Pomphorhynchus laevis]|nr:hypothetical protein GJ496_005641 [Pomphorhynchus laevis]
MQFNFDSLYVGKIDRQSIRSIQAECQTGTKKPDSKDIGKIQVEDNNEYTVSNYASWLKEDTSYSNLFNATTMIRGLTANFNEKHIYKMIDDIRNLCHDPIKYKGKAVINMELPDMSNKTDAILASNGVRLHEAYVTKVKSDKGLIIVRPYYPELSDAMKLWVLTAKELRLDHQIKLNVKYHSLTNQECVLACNLILELLFYKLAEYNFVKMEKLKKSDEDILSLERTIVYLINALELNRMTLYFLISGDVVKPKPFRAMMEVILSMCEEIISHEIAQHQYIREEQKLRAKRAEILADPILAERWLGLCPNRQWKPIDNLSLMDESVMEFYNLFTANKNFTSPMILKEERGMLFNVDYDMNPTGFIVLTPTKSAKLIRCPR